eukprot:SAG11_NODE_44_length_20765_cov_5.183635_18_plen_76_part_00
MPGLPWRIAALLSRLVMHSVEAQATVVQAGVGIWGTSSLLNESVFRNPQPSIRIYCGNPTIFEQFDCSTQAGSKS